MIAALSMESFTKNLTYLQLHLGTWGIALLVLFGVQSF